MMNQFEEINNAAINPAWEEFDISLINRNYYSIPASQWMRFYHVAKANGFEVVEDFGRHGMSPFYVAGTNKDKTNFRSQIRAKLGLPL